MASNFQKAEEIFLSGKASWVKAVNPDQKYNKWSMQLHPNAESLEIIRDLQTQGVRNQMKKDEDGYYMSFSRPVSKTYRGKIRTFTPPVVMNADKTPLEGLRVGNGSDVTIKIEAYPYNDPTTGNKGKAVRWESMRVDNLVPFNPDTDYPDEEATKVSGLKDQPEALF